jgi:hypothetical protein
VLRSSIGIEKVIHRRLTDQISTVELSLKPDVQAKLDQLARETGLSSRDSFL